MRIIRNYIISEALIAFAICIFIFTFVLIAGRFVDMTDLIINKGVSILDIGKLFLLFLPYILVISVPMALLTACVFIFGKMSSDNEITALLCSGITFPKMITPVIYVSILISLCCLYLHDRVVPFTRFRSRQMTRFISIGRPEGFLEPGTFIKRFQPHVLFIGEMKKDIMRRVHIYQPEEGGTTRAVFAQEARVLPGQDENSIRLNLYNGMVNEPNPNEPGSFFRILFDEYIITLRIAEDRLPDMERRTREMSINELREQIKELESKSIDPRPLSTQIQWKLSLSFACIPLVLIAIPVGIKIRKSEKFIAFGISIAIILAYYILFLAAYMLSTQGKIPSYFLWTPNVLFTVIGIWLMSRINK